MAECKKCGLQYSSYCIGCLNAKQGLNLTDKEYTEYLKSRTPKERGADNPKITCLNCKHLMFSDMYGECNKQLKTVNPNDTCEYAEPKERGDDRK